MAQQDGRTSHSFHSSAEFVKLPPHKYTFRYFSEGRTQGTAVVKIRVNNYEGNVKAVLACITAEGDPLPHPNQLKCGRHRCTSWRDGVCTIEKYITKKNNIIVFNQIVILRVKHGEAKEALCIRTSNTDFPYVRGYHEGSTKVNLDTISYTHVRFACQVLTQDAAGQLRNPLAPVFTSNRVSHYREELRIMDASHDRGQLTGGLRVFLFTATLPSSVGVVFRERGSDWRAQGKAVKQHKKVALHFTTPPHHDPYCPEPVEVYYFMVQGQTRDYEDEQDNDLNRRDFTYLPITDEDVLKSKLEKTCNQRTKAIIMGVKTGNGAGGSGGGGGAVAGPAERMEIQRLQLDAGNGAGGSGGGGGAVAGPVERMEIHRPQLDNDIPLEDGAIPEPRRAQHPDRPISPNLLEFLIQQEPQAEEVDRRARNNLEEILSIKRYLLDENMDVDVTGSEHMPG